MGCSSGWRHWRLSDGEVRGRDSSETHSPEARSTETRSNQASESKAADETPPFLTYLGCGGNSVEYVNATSFLRWPLASTISSATLRRVLGLWGASHRSV